MSLLSGSLHHLGLSLSDFVDWCDGSCLELNVIKTQEMIVTFSKRQRELAEAVVTTIHGEPVELVERYKYLGKRQWQYFLRKLNCFRVEEGNLCALKLSYCLTCSPLHFLLSTIPHQQTHHASNP